MASGTHLPTRAVLFSFCVELRSVDALGDEYKSTALWFTLPDGLDIRERNALRVDPKFPFSGMLHYFMQSAREDIARWNPGRSHNRHWGASKHSGGQ
jgi:hypothetical protein